MLRGIPTGSVALSADEKIELCAKLKGHWKIQAPHKDFIGRLKGDWDPKSPNKGKAMTLVRTYTDVEVKGDVITISGGMVTAMDETDGANLTQSQKIIPFRGSDGTIYIDNIGSLISREEEGEIEINNSFGVISLWQRGWKRDGGAPPQSAKMQRGSEPVPLDQAESALGL